MSSIIIGAGSSELASIPVFNIYIGQSANVIEMSYDMWGMILDV